MSINSVSDYQDLVTSEHVNQPDFMATIAISVAAMVQVQSLMGSMIPIFDLATPPVGDQLDIIGQWVQASRDVIEPIPGVFFSWNDTVIDGWNSGSWQDPNNHGTSLIVLPDDAYLTLINAKIAANQWDGTTEGAYAIWDIVLPHFTLLIQDNQDMSMGVGIVGGVLDALTMALLTGGYLPLKPEGVRITEFFVPVDTNPFFGWGVNTAFIQGWGTGSWASELTGV